MERFFSWNVRLDIKMLLSQPSPKIFAENPSVFTQNPRKPERLYIFSGFSAWKISSGNKDDSSWNTTLNILGSKFGKKKSFQKFWILNSGLQCLWEDLKNKFGNTS